MQLLENGEQGRQTFDEIFSFGMDDPLAWDHLYVKKPDGKFRRKSGTNLVDSIYGKDGDAEILSGTNPEEERKRNKEQKKQVRRLCKMGLLNLFEKVRLV